MTPSSRLLEQELVARVSSGKAASQALGHRVFISRHIPDETKAQVAVLFCAASWPRLSARQGRRVEAALLQPLRRAATCLQQRGLQFVHLPNDAVKERFHVLPLQARRDLEH
jgi:hypothetical protein